MNTQKYLKNVVSLSYDPSKCIGCGLCIDVCPHAVFTMTERKVQVVRQDNCIECGACVLNCVPGALDVKQGVGCASAIIYGFLKGTEPTCDCGGDVKCC